MITRAALDFVKFMVRKYGVVSCFNNVDEDENTLEGEGLWFECPYCNEVIAIGTKYTLKDVALACPICGEEFFKEFKKAGTEK